MVEANPGESLGNHEPAVIVTSPFSEAFRQEIGRAISGKIIFGVVLDNSIRNNKPLVAWDGLDRAGERKLVTLVPSIDNLGFTDTVSIELSEIDDNRNPESRGSVTLTANKKKEQEGYYIGEGNYHFLDYFQTICKAVEDGIAVAQIENALSWAQASVPRSDFKRVFFYGDYGDYSSSFYRDFVKYLSQQKYLAH